MIKAEDIMTTEVVTIRGSATVAEAVALMKERHLRSLIVEPRTENDPYGMITETDIVFDTLRAKAAEILGSTSPLNLEPLRYLSQRWFSPQALKPRLRSALTLSEAEGLTFPLPEGSCITANFAC
jgi:CBS-domain-containing membrane protein